MISFSEGKAPQILSTPAWIANVHLETDGMVNMLKSLKPSIAMTLLADMKNKLKSPGDHKLLRNLEDFLRSISIYLVIYPNELKSLLLITLAKNK